MKICVFCTAASDAFRTSASELSSEVFAAGAGIPPEMISASGIISACATLLYKQNLQWERTVDSLTASEQELASVRSVQASKPALPGLRSRSTSNAGLAAPAAAPEPPAASGAQTPIADDLQQQAAFQARAESMLRQPVPQQRAVGSTESEDEERNVVPLSLVKLPPSGNRRDDDIESDAASVRSASTLDLANGVQELPALRRARPS